jgi:hypothetical protein
MIDSRNFNQMTDRQRERSVRRRLTIFLKHLFFVAHLCFGGDEAPKWIDTHPKRPALMRNAVRA